MKSNNRHLLWFPLVFLSFLSAGCEYYPVEPVVEDPQPVSPAGPSAGVPVQPTESDGTEQTWIEEIKAAQAAQQAQIQAQMDEMKKTLEEMKNGAASSAEPGYYSANTEPAPEVEVVSASTSGSQTNGEETGETSAGNGVAPGPGEESVPKETGATLAELYTIDVIGGAGGSEPQEVTCGAKDVVTGVKVRHGSVIDQIAGLYCKPFDKLDDITVNPTFKPAGFGGAGGSEAEVKAVKGYALTGFNIKIVPWDTMTLVGEMKTLAKKVDPMTGVQDTSEVTAGGDGFKFGQGSADYGWTDLKCPDDHVLKGVRARFGLFLDALGAVCQRISPAGEAVSTPEKGKLGLGKGDEMPLVHPANGGIKGSQFRAECPENKVVVGWYVRYGAAIDQIEKIACLDINDVASETGSPELIQVNAGGYNGSEPEYIPASLGYAMRGWNNKSSGFDGGFVVTELQAVFVNVEADGLVWNETETGKVLGEGSGAEPWRNHSADPGYLLTGFKGRSGKFLDALTGITREVVKY